MYGETASRTLSGRWEAGELESTEEESYSVGLEDRAETQTLSEDVENHR